MAEEAQRSRSCAAVSALQVVRSAAGGRTGWGMMHFVALAGRLDGKYSACAAISAKDRMLG